MAKVYISEFNAPQDTPAHSTQVAFDSDATIDQVVDFSGGVQSSVAFSSTTALIRVHVDAVCSFKVGKAPVATTANKRIAADQTEYLCVKAGDKLSAIANT